MCKIMQVEQVAFFHVRNSRAFGVNHKAELTSRLLRDYVVYARRGAEMNLQNRDSTTVKVNGDAKFRISAEKTRLARSSR